VSESDIEGILQAQGKSRQMRFRKLPVRVHRFLGPCDAGFAVDVPSVNPRRLWADVQWVRRQWTNPRSRLSGEGNVPATILPKQENGMDAPAVLAPLRSPNPVSHIPEICPKCRNPVLATHEEGSLLWVRCWACGWSAPLRG
jgi:hypothetical protein